MGPYHRKNIVVSRRRVEDEGEDEGSTVDLEDDSLSDGSIISTVDDEADMEGSDITEEPLITSMEKQVSSPNGTVDVNQTASNKIASAIVAATPATTDTEVMRNGFKIPEDVGTEDTVSFDEMTAEQVEAPRVQEPQRQPSRRWENGPDRRRRDHEDYRRKRDDNPAFVPNKGGFFMHDQRYSGAGPNNFKANRYAVRPRAPFQGPPNPARSSQAPEPMEVRWTHDLHEDISQPLPPNRDTFSRFNGATKSAVVNHSAPAQGVEQPQSFSQTVQIGNVQLRVMLPGMTNPIIFPAVPVKQHTRLPNHRPPLRRDKPVRISLPGCPPRYIFPSMQRSFIFIPRALRPNQQVYQRGRGRGTYGGYGSYGSRRTSIYGGSVVNTPSVAMSRRSSIGRVLTQNEPLPRSGSNASKTGFTQIEPAKPVVRLPPPSQQPVELPPPRQSLAASVKTGPTMEVSAASQAHPTPQTFVARDAHPEPLPMHQPRPQKAVSLAGIESPATMPFNPPQPQPEQPFHQQVPDPAAFQGQIPPSVQAHPTPFPQIPERAIHAPPFQPYQYAPVSNFYPQAYGPPQPLYYYPPPTTEAPAYTNVSLPNTTPFVPGSQPMPPYMIPSAVPTTEAGSSGQSSIVAHESNGMVYYYDSSQQIPTPNPPYGPTSYNIHGMMTPPGGYYYPPYQGPVYYSGQQ